jgi:phage tail sheath protein FI
MMNFWSKVSIYVAAHINNLFRNEPLGSLNPRKAYFVKCDGKSMTQVDIDNGIVNILVGFAPLKPAEFVVIKIQQMTGCNSNSLMKKYRTYPILEKITHQKANYQVSRTLVHAGFQSR